ncbi:PREDICTED: probable inactive receptor-like protein kinase At1g65250 [Camelina sativa]|uniref:Probable inactive receptor-like protein kinase At1g65250 n=1 Tax=Camelina sativa TaxID=90675 RepID=A0ABM1QGE9_CAMSA|nr:PREDICTED: probable inactive receptor-like protein kinase At1g65250 [Camelina sativa]
MDWWKTKKSLRAVVKKERSVRGRERGEILLEELIKCCDGKPNPIKFFSADQILEATDTFSESNRASELFDDTPYDWYHHSGKNNNHHHHHHHQMILIKKWRYRFNEQNRGNFCRDIAISSMVSGHKNFMKLVGCGLESEHPVLVYRAVTKPSNLDLKTLLSWRKRLKVAEEIATALAYLHTAFTRPFVYRILRLGDILLDDEGDGGGVAKLCNFSHCVSIPQGETFVTLDCSCLGGDYDYMDDNYLINGVVSEKTDAFGFGIFMQKLLTGEERFRELLTLENRKFPNWLSRYIGEGRIDEIVDTKMLEKMGEVTDEERCRMEAFLVLSERCIGRRGEVPKMVEVAKELKILFR